MKKSINKLLPLFFLIVFGMSIFSNCGQAQIKIENDKISSPMIQEEDTSYYKTDFPPTMNKMTEADENVRKFVWEHWRDKRNGTVTREGVNKHGEKYIGTYKIKCSENKDCKVFVEIKGENFGRGEVKPDKPNRHVSYVADSVDRVENPTDYYYTGEVNVISDNVEKTADLYFVRLKDENGKTKSLL
jgi:hypothetical protein